MKRKILVVDDEVMITELLLDHLGDEGYEVYIANSAARALELLSENPDLIILDINMPETDGLEFCKNIREHVWCPILFLTARISEQDNSAHRSNQARTTGSHLSPTPYAYRTATSNP